MAKLAAQPGNESARWLRTPNTGSGTKNPTKNAGRLPSSVASPEMAQTYALELAQSGRLPEALRCFEQAIDRFGPSTGLLYNRAVALQRAGRHDEALLSLNQIDEPADRMAAVYFAMGVNNQALMRYKEAVRAYDRATSSTPRYPEAHNNRGIALQMLGLWDEAIRSHRAAIADDPAFADAHNSLGAALIKVDKLDEALQELDKALSINPNHREALNNRGTTLHRLGRLDEAIMCLDKAVTIAPDYAAALTNRANCYSELGRADEASNDYDAALLVDPSYSMARFNRSLASLHRGDFKSGWSDYEYRSLTVCGEPIPICAQNGWNGTPKPNGEVYVRAEQGFGDTIQFIRFLPFVKQRCARVVLECQRDLVPLLKNAPGCDEIVERPAGNQMWATPSGADHVFLMSLPGIFGIDATNIPATVPYISPTQQYRQIWQHRVEYLSTCYPGMRIGIAWAGSRDHPNDRRRSCSISHFERLVMTPGVRLFSLQKGDARDQLEQSAFAYSVVDLSYGLLDFADTAAAIAAMDLVISVDSSVAHLAGALGKPTWLLLPHTSDWRWMESRTDSPWYPTVELFRQTDPEADDPWRDVFQCIQERLEGIQKSAARAA